MPWQKLRLPNQIIKSVDQDALPGAYGNEIFDCYINQFGNFVKRPGLDSSVYANIGNYPIDGMYWWQKKGVMLLVSNGSIYKATTSTGTYTDVGGVDLNAGTPVSFVEIEGYIAMANGGKVVLYDNSAVPFYITAANAPTAVTHVANLDRYLLCLQADSSLLWYSDSADPTAWTSATQFVRNDKLPDDTLSMHVIGSYIYCFGKRSIEIWYNAGDPFTLSRLYGATMSRGLWAPYSVVRMEDSFYFLDSNKRISRLTGQTLEEISNPFDDEIRDVTPGTNAIGMGIDIGSKSFYVLNYLEANKTYVYDIKERKWGKWGYWDSTAGNYNRFLCNHYAYCDAWNLHLFGSRLDGKIYKMGADQYQDAGVDIRFFVDTGWINFNTSANKRGNRLRFRLKRGAGGTSGNEPVFSFRYCKDGKIDQWSNYRSISLGKQGEYEHYVHTGGIGMFRDLRCQFIHADNTPMTFIEAEIDIDLMRN